MATTIVLCDRCTVGKTKRIKLDSINLNDNVGKLRIAASQKTNLPKEQIELIYCGRCLQDDETLESYGVKPGTTVHALKKTNIEDNEQPLEKMDKASIQQVVTALQAAIINPSHRAVLEQMLKNSETVDNIIAATPKLDKDPVAVGCYICNIFLFDVTFNSFAIFCYYIRVIEAHPSLAHAAMHVAAAVNEAGAKAGPSTPSRTQTRSTGTFSLDQMSDDEDLMEQVQPAAGGPAGAPLLGQSPGGITAAHLAAALAAAAGRSRPPDGSGPSTSGQGPPVITSDFFAQAMQQVAQSPNMTGPHVSGPQPPSQEQLQSQLQQLRDMGITDIAMATRALEATGGNIQAALELLFSDDIM
ncbi:ubiquitin-like protein 7 [Lingula anatina]|uniref:Ubiquitin-like protein 7 n=1 Tax=Lingula anatina TaxID=7574 RepID=A0A1S3HDQ1_LINAN|nr:ubiquitin-like protein 7 [Lingula anatina]|eukprot:XP_013384155.1 ubiquitin-like protein 7 [Lingula anatina]